MLNYGSCDLCGCSLTIKPFQTLFQTIYPPKGSSRWHPWIDTSLIAYSDLDLGHFKASGTPFSSLSHSLVCAWAVFVVWQHTLSCWGTHRGVLVPWGVSLICMFQLKVCVKWNPHKWQDPRFSQPNISSVIGFAVVTDQCISGMMWWWRPHHSMTDVCKVSVLQSTVLHPCLFVTARSPFHIKYIPLIQF